ncbi:zinc finger MYM-type protein 1-like [Tachypleus tridentatus]|uniref:zinc finger MYM-type protein 1-like n=1 Tax=Tachypleus tridentatus TaxID=6853 RepID=UPI003FCEF239
MISDEIMKKKLSGPGNAKYTYHDIQNELLDIIVGMIKNYISKEVMEAEHFVSMVDETKDVSKREQLSIVCYDGAAVMPGHISGVQERLRREVSQAVYVHCYAHRLNLVLVDCVQNVQAAAEFFVTIQKLYKFFSTSLVHEEFLKVQKELEPVNQHIEFKRLSETRWVCQHAACLAVKRTLPAIVTTLKHFVEGDNVHRAIESKGLWILLDQQFVTSLVVLEKLLLMTKQLSDPLQSPDLQLASAEGLVQSVISDLLEMRTEAAWKDLKEPAEDICKKVEICTETVRQSYEAENVTGEYMLKLRLRELRRKLLKNPDQAWPFFVIQQSKA